MKVTNKSIYDYKGGKNMEREVSKVIPVAKSITKFEKENIGNELVIVDGWHIVKYAEEYPIIRYKCDEISTIHISGGFHLNSFIESITVSNVFPKTSSCNEKIDDEILVYYTDNTGIRRSVMQYDICEFLIKRPRIVVSPEGMLIFFTENQIIATIDCDHYLWIDGHEINLRGKTIKAIEVYEEYTKIILVNKKGMEYNFSLKFDFDMAAHQMICPKVFKL